jgi:hypothetical protein
MPNTTSQRRSDSRPTRGPTKRANGLDPEITAQPRPISDDLGRDVDSEPGLSIDPEDLGNRFLRDATEQGDFDPSPVSELELSLMEDPTADDDTQVGAHLAYVRSVWDQTVDLELQTRGAADQLREPALPPEDEFDTALDDPRADDSGEVHLAQSYIREVSLLDREGSEGDETEVPDIDSEDGGRHARNTPRGELGKQMENPASAPRRVHRAARAVSTLERGSRAVALKAAGWLRRISARLQR